MRRRVLLVEDSPTQAALYRAYLPDDAFDVRHVESAEEALEACAASVPEAILLDLELPGMHGLEALPRLASLEPAPTCIVITDHGSADNAARALHSGASDFLTKPFDASRLLVTLRNALRTRDLATTVETYRDRHGFVGESPPMQAVYRIIEAAAPSRATVFVTGESGTGKEVCARAIHRAGPRADRPFVAINCAALPRDLVESELFGHVRGAFTGAHRTRDGAATRANGGTLFLDELCEMDLDLQAKLLRFVQTGEFQRVGDSAPQQVDVRLICATNRDPLAEVRRGRFREDLYYRLHVLPVALPPLRERGEDVVRLARRFLRTFARDEGRRLADFDPDAIAALLAHAWPGNVRELENCIRSLVVLNDGPLVTRSMLPKWADDAGDAAGLVTRPLAPVTAAATARPAAAPFRAAPSLATASHATPSYATPAGEIRPLAVVEREAIEHALAVCGGHVPRAAAALHVSASTLYRKLQAWGDTAVVAPRR